MRLVGAAADGVPENEVGVFGGEVVAVVESALLFAEGVPSGPVAVSPVTPVTRAM